MFRRLKLPRRIVCCKNCGHRIDVDSDVLIFLGLGILLGILLASVLCSTAYAQEKPEALKPKHDRKIFIVGVSLLAASKSADAFTTSQLLDRGGWENNSLLGRHPSNGRLAAFASGQLALQSTAFYFTERNRHAWVRWLGRAYIGFAIEERVRLAACNAGINPHSGRVQNCRIF